MSEETNSLKATSRTAGPKSAVRAIRREGRIPGVIYGHDIKDVLVSVDPKEFELRLRTEYTYNAVFDLAVDGGDTYRVMVKDMQFDSVKRVVTHIDFKVVRNDEKVFVEVPIVTEGIAAGVTKGGRLQLVRRSVKVATTVERIPAKVVYNVKALEIGDQVYVDEMTAPEGSAFEFNHRYPVIRLARPRTAVEVTPNAAATPDAGEAEAAAEA